MSSPAVLLSHQPILSAPSRRTTPTTNSTIHQNLSFRSQTSTPNNNVRLHTARKEVDYYLNPTDLFRWINYRRWDGAKARAESHPAEVSTWIVSKSAKGDGSSSGSSTGDSTGSGSGDHKILWRHLPLHLVCMQSGNVSNIAAVATASGTSSNPLTQLEELVDVLISIYPDAVSLPDEQGMLPIHLAVSNGASERVINLLLLSSPSCVNARDKYNRLPIDIVNEIPASARRDTTLKALQRAREKIDALASAVRNETADEVAKVQESAANERVASQRIIMRMEEELKDAKRSIDNFEKENLNQKETERNISEEKNVLQQQLHSQTEENTSLRRQIAELRINLDKANQVVKEHDFVVQGIRQKANDEKEKHNEYVASLKSEVATAKAMSDAIEEQLRSRFAQEEYLSNTVVDLESKLHKANEALEAARKTFKEQKDALQNEVEQHKKTADDVTKRNVSYQNRIGELNQQVSNLLASQASFQAEHDRLIEASARHEHDLLEAIHAERERLLNTIEKQRGFFEGLWKEQEQIMKDAVKKEGDVRSDYRQERERSLMAVEHLSTQFKTLHAAERERKLKQTAGNVDLRRTMSQSTNPGAVSSSASNRMYPPPPNSTTATAGGVGGASIITSTTIGLPTTMEENHFKSPVRTSPINHAQHKRIESPHRHSMSPSFSRNDVTQVPSHVHHPQAMKHVHETTRVQPPTPVTQEVYNSPSSVLDPLVTQKQTTPATYHHRNMMVPSPPQDHRRTHVHSSQRVEQITEIQEENSSQRGFEVLRSATSATHETPPFEVSPPPALVTDSYHETRRKPSPTHPYQYTTKKAPPMPAQRQFTSDEDDDESSINPGPVQRGQLLRFLEDRAEKQKQLSHPSSASSSPREYHHNSTAAHVHHIRSIAIADNDEYSQGGSTTTSHRSSPSSVTGYAYRTATSSRSRLRSATSSAIGMTSGNYDTGTSEEVAEF